MPELIIFVGLPGSGKSTFYRNQLAGTHELISKDLMPNVRDRETRQQLEIDKALRAGKNVAVDNTNPTAAIRAPLIEVGKKHGARVIACYFQANVRACIMRNRQRQGKERVPDVAIFTTQKKLVPPATDEGFDEVR